MCQSGCLKNHAIILFIEECWRLTMRRLTRKLEYLQSRDGPFCYWCNKELDITIRQDHFRDWDAATIDHVEPKSAGGWATRDNTVLACRHCNLYRGNVPASQTLIWLKHRQIIKWIAKQIIRSHNANRIYKKGHEY